MVLRLRNIGTFLSVLLLSYSESFSLSVLLGNLMCINTQCYEVLLVDVMRRCLRRSCFDCLNQGLPVYPLYCIAVLNQGEGLSNCQLSV